MLPSSTVENYLKAISLGATALRAPDRLLPMGQLAASLGVAPGTGMHTNANRQPRPFRIAMAHGAQ